MRILISALRFQPGRTYGAETYLSAVLESLHETLDRDTEVTFAGTEEACQWAKKIAPGLEYVAHRSYALPVARMLNEQFAVRRIAIRYQPDVVFFPFNTMPAMRTPSVLMLHDLVSHLYRQSFPGYQPLHNSVLWAAVRRSIRRADFIVTPSRAVADEVVAMFDRESVVPILEAAVCRSGLAFEPQVANQRFVLLLTGSKLPHKSQHTALEALAVMRQSAEELFDSTSLVVTGGNESELRDLQAHADRLGVSRHVDWLGKVDGAVLERLMSSATLHLFPTLYEGFGLGLVEAQIRGKAVVASGIPVLEEVSGGIGAFFEPGNAEQMCHEIVRLLRNPEQRRLLEESGKAHAASWTWADHTRELLNVLRQAAST